MSAQIGDRSWQGGNTGQARNRDPAEFEVSFTYLQITIGR